MKCFAERAGSDYDDAFWAAVYALYEDAFPGLSRGIAAASDLGFHWPEVTTPFAYFEGGRCVAHVGVLMHPMRLVRRDVEIAGVHAVCTASDRRRRGLARELLSIALDWADARTSAAKLHTDLPAVYEPHSFRARETWRFLSRAPAAQRVDCRPLRPGANPDDAHTLRDLLARRAPVSDVCASRDDGWMVGIVAALSGRLESMWWLPDHDAIVSFSREGERNLVLEVIAERMPSAEVIAAAAPEPERELLYTFSPDLFEPEAEAVPVPAEQGTFMARGAFPDAAIGLSPLWEH